MTIKEYKSKKNKEFSECNHIWLIKKGDRDSKHCIKCNLTDDSFYQEENLDNKIMKEYILNHSSTLLKGIRLDIECDYEEVKAIYNIIKYKKPDLDEETMKKYIEISICKINSKKEREEQYNKRIKRLGLK